MFANENPLEIENMIVASKKFMLNILWNPPGNRVA
jgi:hypothetical protein